LKPFHPGVGNNGLPQAIALKPMMGQLGSVILTLLVAYETENLSILQN
jgi:hypothetical protein